ncbi:MAG: pre-peptidase, partial [Okeania sp. SIO3B3]|nr:pre-peptidase [Okeania sp. SIO3B3]
SSSGGRIQYSGFSTADKSIRHILAPGTYFVEVFSSSETDYNLNLGATPIPDLVGNTRETASRLNTLRKPQELTGKLNQVNTKNYYQFELAPGENSHAYQLDLGLNGLSAAASVELLSSSGGRIQYSGFSTADKSIRHILAPGTYFVEVFSSSETDYNLTLSAT